MEEKLVNPRVRTGLISMTGEVKTNNTGGVKCPTNIVEMFKSGDVPFLMGHAESWLTNLAVEITASLMAKGLIVGTFLDEFQMNLCQHWGSDFR